MRTLADFMDAHPEAGIGGCSIENEDGSSWPIAFRFPSAASELEQEMKFGPVSHLMRNVKIVREMQNAVTAVDWVSGACMIIRKQVFEDIGLMDEGYFLYFEEIDFCLRAHKQGWSCWYIPQSRIMHLSGESTGASGTANAAKRMPDYWFASRSRYFVKNHGIAYARMADCAFILGMTFWRIRNFAFRRHGIHRARMLRDFLRTSVLFKSRASIARRTGALHDV
jgi:N-acetylglucosaminyl-diphospho-decaprenol L-rhamnosyltransferase